MAIEYTGKVMGSVRKHSPQTVEATWKNAYVVLPQEGQEPKIGLLKDLSQEQGKFPVVVFMHGSSGVNAQIKLFAYWLSDALKVATIVPDSMQTQDRLTYSSPVSPEDYEDVHSMRLDELDFAMKHIKSLPWAKGKVVIAGTSEGGVTAARYNPEKTGVKEDGRMIFSWSCEDNYHVKGHNSCIADDIAVLNVMSSTDKFFSQVNSYLNNPNALGHAGRALANNPNAEIILIPGAPHTLINLTRTRDAVACFINRLIRQA